MLKLPIGWAIAPNGQSSSNTNPAIDKFLEGLHRKIPLEWLQKCSTGATAGLDGLKSGIQIFLYKRSSEWRGRGARAHEVVTAYF